MAAIFPKHIHRHVHTKSEGHPKKSQTRPLVTCCFGFVYACACISVSLLCTFCSVSADVILVPRFLKNQVEELLDRKEFGLYFVFALEAKGFKLEVEKCLKHSKVGTTVIQITYFSFLSTAICQPYRNFIPVSAGTKRGKPQTTNALFYRS